MPSRGLFDNSPGTIRPTPSASCGAAGNATMVVEAAMGFPSVLGANGRDDGESRTQRHRGVRVVERNLHRDSLHDFRVVTGCIVGWEQRKLRAAGGWILVNLPWNTLSGYSSTRISAASPTFIFVSCVSR